MWVADQSEDKIFAYKMSDESRDSAKDITLHTDNANAVAVWSNGSTIWVTNNSSTDSGDKVFAYKLSDVTRESTKDFGTLDDAGNNDPSGLWSDGITMWVVNENDAKVYAYKVR